MPATTNIHALPAPAPEATLTVALPAEAIVAALAQSPELLELLAQRVAALLETPRRDPEDELLGVERTAEYLDDTVHRVYDLTSQGKLIALKSGGKSKYTRAELDRHLGRENYERALRRRQRCEERAEEVQNS